MNSINSLDYRLPSIEEHLELFVYNPELYKNAKKFVGDLRLYFSKYQNVEISLFGVSNIKDSEGIDYATEICLRMDLFGLPVFFEINQNSYIRVLTSPAFENQEISDFWFQYQDCLIKVTDVNDPEMPIVFNEILSLMEHMSRLVCVEFHNENQAVITNEIQKVKKKSLNVLYQAPVLATILTLLLQDEYSQVSLTDRQFLLDLISNTGLVALTLSGLDYLGVKLK